MNFKFSMILLCLVSLCHGTEFKQLKTAIKNQDTISVKSNFEHFFTSWKSSTDSKETEQISEDTKLYKLCLDALNKFPLLKYTNLPIAERNKLTDSIKSEISFHRILFAIMAVGYIEKNPIANEFAEKLKKESENSDKSKALFEIWNETINDFKNEKYAVEANKIVNGKNLLPYFITLLEKQKYLTDVKSQYIINATSSQPELLTKNEAFKENQEFIINLLERNFNNLPQDVDNVHYKTWRGQRAFVLLHQFLSSPERHSEWVKQIIQQEKVSTRFKRKFLRSYQ